MVTGLYAAVLAVLQIIFTLNVVQLRRGEKVSLGDGGHEALNRKIRAHANFTETVPMALILMLVAEFSGAPLWSVSVLGAVLLISRVMHYIALTTGKGYGSLRVYSMVLTLSVLLLGAVLCAVLSLPVLLSRPLS